MLTKLTCPECRTTLAIEIKQTTNYNVKFKKDGTASRYEQQIENLEITKAKEINKTFNKIHKTIQPKLKNGIKTKNLKKELRKKYKMDYKTTQAFISKIKKQGVIEKNQELRYPT